MKYYIYISFLAIILSCNSISQSDEQKFIDMNKSQLDTIRIFNNLNDSLYSLLDTTIYMRYDINEYEKISLKFSKFYYTIDSIQKSLIDRASNSGDIEIVNKVMIEEKGEIKLQNKTKELKKLIAPNIHALQFDDLYYKSIDQHIYVTTNVFNNTPLFSAIHLLNKWKADKLKEQYLILLKVTEIPNEKNPQKLNVGTQVNHSKYGIGKLMDLSDKYVGTFRFKNEERKIILKFTKFEIVE